MIITNIEKNDKKYYIYIDGEYIFSLYYVEVKKYKLKLNNEISKSDVENIVNDIIIKRGINYIYYLLAKKDYTKQEIYNKLIKAKYIDEYSNEIIQFLEDKGLVNDYNYAEKYIDQMHLKKSILQIVMKLQQKGIDKSIIYEIIDKNSYSEYEAAKMLLNKKMKNKCDFSIEQKNKFYKYLSSKGFKADTIKNVINSMYN